MVGVRHDPRVRFEVLGPVRAFRDGRELSLGGRQQRLVLALLIAAAGRTVPTGRLIDGVWGDEPRPSAKKALQGHVHHLRSQVGDVVVTERNGYSIRAQDDVDAEGFERLRRDASELLDVDPRRASELLKEALALWNGPAYADMVEEPALAPERTRLDDLRVLALGDLVDADLALGRHAAVIGELEALTREHPLRERFRAQHMTALYRAGRQVEALRVYEHHRRYLLEEMGLEPSTDLQHLEQRILTQDPDLLGPADSRDAAPTMVRGYELRELVASGPHGQTYRAYQRSVGRQMAVKVLTREVADDPEFIANFIADTKAVAALDHPHICFVVDTWREPGRAFRVSRWLDGGSLADALRTGKLGSGAAMRMLDQVGGALAHAHRHGVVHGQISPSHVLFDEPGFAYLSEFNVGGSIPDADAARDRRDFAALAHCALTGRPPRVVDGLLVPDLHDVDTAAAARPVFELAFSADGHRRVEDFLRALRQATGSDTVTPPDRRGSPRRDVRNPYKGLRAFQESDAADFFGRDEVVETVIRQLTSRRLVAVIGPSGSGKSSLVKAGVLPRLRSSDFGGPLLISEMYPGRYPFEELEEALLGVGVGRESIIGDLLGDERGLMRVLKQILPSDDAELLLVVDQFEELFSMITDEDMRRLFLDSLVAATADPRSRLRVLVTMRADFFDRPLEYPAFGASFNEGLVPVTTPTDEQLASAIVEPVRSSGVDYEPGLISHIVHEVSGQPGGLPLLQYALTALFEDRDSSTLTLAAYQRSGGVLGALGRRAEQLYVALRPTAQHAARHAFLRMVSVDESVDDLRRRVRRSELSSLDVDERALNEAIHTYGDRRLLTFDLDPVTRGPTIEVAHEALLRAWPRLERWIDEQREDLVMRNRLDTALTEWRDAGEEPSYLPGGGRLAQFNEWASDSQLPLSVAEHEFLGAAIERETLTRRRARRRRHGILAVLASVAVVLAIAAAFALVQRRNADASAEAAEDARLAAVASSVSGSDMSLGLLLAVEAFDRNPDPAAQGALLAALTAHGPHLGFGPTDRDYAGIAMNDDGNLFVLDSQRISLIDPRSREVLREWPLDTGPAAPLLVDASRLAIGGDTAMYVDAERRIRLLDLRDPTAIVRAVDLDRTDGVDMGWLSPSGRYGLFFSFGPEESDANTLNLIELDSGRTRWTVRPQQLIDDHPLAEGSLGLIGGEPANSPSAVFVDDATVAIAAGMFLGTFDVTDGTLLDVAAPFAGEKSDRLNGTVIDTVPGGGFLVAGVDLVSWYDAELERLASLEFPKAGSGTGGGSVASDIADVVAHPDGRTTVLFHTGAIWEVERAGQTKREVGSSEVGGWAIANVAGEATFAVVGDSGMAYLSSDGRGPLNVGIPRPPDQTKLAVGANNAFVVSSSVHAETASVHLCHQRRCDDPVDFGATNLQVDNGSPDVVSVVEDVEETYPWWRAELTVVDPETGATRAAPMTILGETVPDVVVTTDSWIAFPEFQGIAVHDLQTGRELAWFELTDFGLINGAFDPGGERLLIIEGTTPYLLDTATWESVELPRPLSFATAAWSADGSLFITVDASGRMTIRDGATWAPQRAVTNSRLAATAHADQPLVFSSDDRYLLGVTNGAAQLWDVETGQQIGPAIETEPGTTPAVGPGDPASLVTAGPDSTLLWNLDISTWAGIACDLAGRNMTPAEWNQFGPRDEPYQETCPS